MRLKKFAKILTILLVAVAVVGFLAFSTFVYNPFEGTVPELRAGVPLDVDVFAAKQDLADDFERFPRPRVWASFESGNSWSRLREGSFYKARAAELRPLLDGIAELERELGQVPVLGVSILRDGIGKDAVIAAKLRADKRTFDFCAYSRVSWKVRAAIGLLGYAAVRERAGAAKITPVEGTPQLYRIDAPNAESMWLTRVKDVAIIGNSRDLVRDSRALLLEESERDPIHASADYNDMLVAPLQQWSSRAKLDPNALNLMVDVGMLRRFLPGFAEWPARLDDLSIDQRLVDAFITQSAMRRFWGSLVFDGQERSLGVIGHLSINNGELTPFQKRFHEEPPGDKERWLEKFLELVPENAMAVAALRISATVFLTELYHVLDRDSKQYLEGAVRASGIDDANLGVQRGVLDRVGAAFEPWVGIVFRNNDYPAVKGFEFKTSTPTAAPAAALVFRAHKGEEPRVDRFIEEFSGKLRYDLGFRGQEYEMKAGPGGEISIREWGNPLIPATGQVAVLWDGKRASGSYFMVSNSGNLLREIADARYQRGGVQPMTRNRDVADTLSWLPQAISGFAWLNGKEILDVLSRYRAFARKSLNAVPDAAWAQIARPEVQRDVLRRDFSGRSAAQLSAPEQKRLEELIASGLERRWEEERKRLSISDDETFEQYMDYLAFMHAGYLALRADAKSLAIESRFFLK